MSEEPKLILAETETLMDDKGREVKRIEAPKEAMDQIVKSNKAVFGMHVELDDVKCTARFTYSDGDVEEFLWSEIPTLISKWETMRDDPHCDVPKRLCEMVIVSMKDIQSKVAGKMINKFKTALEEST